MVQGGRSTLTNKTKQNNLIGDYCGNRLWPKMIPMTSTVTSHKVKNLKNKVRKHDSSIWQDMRFLGLNYIICAAIGNFSIPSQAYNGEGHVIHLTPDDLHTNLRYAKCEHPGVCYFMKVSSSWKKILSVIGSSKLRHFVTLRRLTCDVIGQWLELTWKWKCLGWRFCVS